MDISDHHIFMIRRARKNGHLHVVKFVEQLLLYRKYARLMVCLLNRKSKLIHKDLMSIIT